MFQDFDVIGLFMLMGDSVSSLVDGVLDLVEAIVEFIAKLFGLSVKGKEVWWAFGKGIENTLRLMTRLVRLTGDLFSALAKAARGDFKGAFKQVIRAFGNFGEGILDDITKGKVGDASDDARSERAQYIMRRLINGGLTPVQAAGIVGNWIQESSLNPETVNGIGASGIGQWLGSRRENLITFASNRGKDWTDLDTQIDFALWEMNEGGEFFNIDGARDDFYSTNSPSKAAVAFRKGYERPGKSEANDSNRINKAETAFDEWNKTNPSSNYDYTDANKSSGPVHLNNNNNKLEVDDFYTPPKEDYSQYFEKTGFSSFLGQGTYAHSLIGGSGMPIMTTANNYNGSSVNIGQINVTAPNGTEPMTAKDVAGAVKKVIPDVNIGGIGNNARDIRNISGVIV